MATSIVQGQTTCYARPAVVGPACRAGPLAARSRSASGTYHRPASHNKSLDPAIGGTAAPVTRRVSLGGWRVQRDAVSFRIPDHGAKAIGPHRVFPLQDLPSIFLDCRGGLVKSPLHVQVNQRAVLRRLVVL